MPESRVKVNLGLTLPLGPYASRRIDIGVEKDAGIDYAAELHGVRLELEKELEDFKTQFKTAADLPTSVPTALPKPVHTPVVTQPVTGARPESGSVAAVTDQQIIEELDTLDWIDNKKRTGWFAPLEEIPLPIRAALINRFNANTAKSLRLGDHNFTRFGDDNSLIGKFPTAKQEKVA